jgi:hypothetical protein
MATNQILSIPDWLLVGSSSQPPGGFSKIYPRSNHSGLTGSWYVKDDVGTEKRLAFDFEIGAGISYSYPSVNSPYGTRLDIQLGGGLSYSQGIYSAAPISVWGITPSMLAITGSYQAGYVLSTSTSSGEFQWVQVSSAIVGPTNSIPKFDGTSLTASRMVDTGSYFYIGSTPSLTNASFSVDYSINIGKNTDGVLYFADQQNNFIKGENTGGMFIRTTDEFVVELYTFSTPTYKILDFDNLTGETRTLKMMNSILEFGDFTQSKYLSASNLNEFNLGKTTSNFLMTLSSNTQGAIKIVDGSQGTYSLLYSDGSGLGKWGKLYGYDGLTTSELGIGLNLVNIQGLTLSGGTFGLDYTKFDLPLKVYDTFTISLATVSVITGITYGSTFETPTFRVDQWGRIIALGTVSTSAFTGPQGPTGFSFTWQGTYATSSTYSFYNVVQYDGSSYISLGTASPGLTPSTVTSSWNLMASKGATGASGQGFRWAGTYSESDVYGYYDVAYYGGSSYISITTSNIGKTPSLATQSWNLMALGSDNATLNVTGTYGAVLVYGEFGWTALGPATAGWVLTSGGTSSLPYWSEPLAASPSTFGTFSRGFTVSLNPGPGGVIKWFGKYKNDDFINAVGLTLEQLLDDVLTEIKAPLVDINVTTPATKVIPFGSIGSAIDLSFGYTIQNAGALAVSGNVNLKIDNDTPFEIWSGITPSNTYNYNVNFTRFDTPTFQFIYTVTDDKGGSASDIDTVQVASYVAPQIQTLIKAKDARLNYGENDYLRERGNVGSEVELTYSRQSPLIDLKTFSVYYRENNFADNLLYQNQTIPSQSGEVTRDHTLTFPVSNPSLSTVTTNLRYKHAVEDIYTINETSYATVTFDQLLFYGPTGSKASLTGAAPTTKAGAYSLPNIKLSSVATNKFKFAAGIVANKFALVIPASKNFVKAQDITQSGQPDLTDRFILQSSQIQIGNYDDSETYPYKVYLYSNAIAYTVPIEIEITLS